MALMKEYRHNNRKLPPMGEVSKITKTSWDVEPKHVKDFYESLVQEAKSNYMKNNIQIVLDKHMDYVEQESGATNDERQLKSVNPILGSVTSVENNNNVSFPTANISLVNSSPNYDNSYELSSIDREYIRVLEQIIDHLLHLLGN